MSRDLKVLEGYEAWPFRVRALPYAALCVATPVVAWAGVSLASDPTARDDATVGAALAGIVALQLGVYLGVLLRAEQPFVAVARALRAGARGETAPLAPDVSDRLAALRRSRVPESRWARPGMLATIASVVGVGVGLWQLVEAYLHGGGALLRGTLACVAAVGVGGWGAASNARAELALIARRLEAARRAA